LDAQNTVNGSETVSLYGVREQQSTLFTEKRNVTADSDLRSSGRVEEAIHVVSFLVAVANSHGRSKQLH